MSETPEVAASEPALPTKPARQSKASGKSGAGRPVRLAIPLLLLACYWVVYAALFLIEITSFMRFLWLMLDIGLLSLLFSLWWLVLGPWRFLQRLLVFLVVLATGGVAMLMLDRSVLPPVVLMIALPAIINLAVLWLLITRIASPRVQFAGLLVIPVLCWAPSGLIRMEGISGEGNPTLFWRWSPTSESIYLDQLAERNDEAADKSTDEASAPTAVELSADDWPGFRGPLRDGAVRGVNIDTDWEASPPKEIWRRRVGPGWSSLAVVDGLLFTQEQRGPEEAVAAYDAETGEQVWSHVEEARFEETLGGPGPRATPTFDNGRLYTLGATGILNCLDAATGDVLWSRNLVEDAGGKVPMWAFAGSPLVVDDLVLVFAGGEQEGL